MLLLFSGLQVVGILLKSKLLMRVDGQDDDESVTPTTTIQLFQGYKK